MLLCVCRSKHSSLLPSPHCCLAPSLSYWVNFSSESSCYVLVTALMMVTAGRIAAGQVLCLHYRTTSARTHGIDIGFRIIRVRRYIRSFVHCIHFTYTYCWILAAVYSDGNIFFIIHGNSRQSVLGSDLTITIPPVDKTYIRSHHQKTITWQQGLILLLLLSLCTRFCIEDCCNTDGILNLPLSATVPILLVHIKANFNHG